MEVIASGREVVGVDVCDIPAAKHELTTVLLPPAEGYGPYSIKGIGEGPHIPVAAAVANAVAAASGARVRDLPATSERVCRALKVGAPTLHAELRSR